MRLGGPIFEETKSPEEWARAIQFLGYRAAYCPVGMDASDDEINAYAQAARDADIVIAEVGAWSNPLSANEEQRHAALDKCRKGLALADRIGARCCVNIAGARGDKWDGPHPDNLTEETFDMIVEVTRGIIDEVKPTRSVFALETMPWIFPDSPESYLRLIEAIDRPTGFAVHFDPVNMINSPSRIFTNADFLKECFRLLGSHIRCCHAKDIAISGSLTVHLDEVAPGLGWLDYGTYLRELNALAADTPIMMEHLDTAEEYRQAASYIRGIANSEGITL